MKHIACSKMWTDLTVSIPRKKIKNCCKRRFHDVSLNDIQTLGAEVFQKHPNLVAERNQTVQQNKLSQGCRECIDMWPNSYWHLWNGWKDRIWEENQLETLNDVTKLIEITLSSTCNMTCMYCAPNISSQWNQLLNVPIEEDIEYKTEMLNALYKYIDKYQVNSVDRPLHYDFLGGEPLLDLEIFSVIERLLELHAQNKDKDVTIGMISNLNVKPKLIERLVKRAEENPNVKWMIKISIDALGTIGEAQRDGLDLQLWEQNLIRLIKSPSIRILILPTVTNVSLIGIPSLIAYITELFDKHNQLEDYGRKWLFGENMVAQPVAMHPGTLPAKYQDVVDECVHAAKNCIPNQKGKQKFIRFLENLNNIINTKRSDKDLAEVKRWFEWQGELKNKNYFEIFPSLKDITE